MTVPVRSVGKSGRRGGGRDSTLARSGCGRRAGAVLRSANRRHTTGSPSRAAKLAEPPTSQHASRRAKLPGRRLGLHFRPAPVSGSAPARAPLAAEVARRSSVSSGPRTAGRRAAGGGEGRSAGGGGGSRPARWRGAGGADRDGRLASSLFPPRPSALPPARCLSPRSAVLPPRRRAASSSLRPRRGAPPRAPRVSARGWDEGARV